MSKIIETVNSGDPENNIDYSWEVRANRRHFDDSYKKKWFLCFQRKKYADNRIKTSKYNLLTFIPLNLYEQYHKAHVIYFTCMLILQCIPQIATQLSMVIIIPLACILLSRGLRDLVDDIARHRSDKLVNNKPCEILTETSLQKKKWKHIQVGDIVCLRKDDFVPADMLLLYSTEPNSLCYLETAGIDGETNLKFRQALTITHTELQNEEALAKFDGLVTCEAPNVQLHKFVGILAWKGKTYPLNNENILLRDCRIRNTERCYGLVIYAGFDTKIMKNSGRVRLKSTKLDVLINKTVLCIAVTVICISFCLAVGAGVWDSLFLKKHNYIPGHPQVSSSTIGVALFWGYLITLSTLVPFFLYISLEVIYVAHNFFINHDLEMYHAESDNPAQARGTSLNDLLGQIEYIFTDKTGTLTQNVMTFKKCCIGQRIFGMTSETEKEHEEVDFAWNTYADNRFKFYDQSLVEELCKNEDPLLCEFFRMIALCHTVMVDENKGGLNYQAASPDEEALVNAARNFGYVFLSRTQETITISEMGANKTYRILALMDFNSARRRMSILVRDEEGKIKLYSKGADSVILQRIHPSCPTDVLVNTLDGFAQETLRTLCLAYKEVEESEYEQWDKRHHEASVSLHNREKHLEDVYEEMENNLQLLGATAIEDKLQDGVPETIQLLKEGNIKIWMLTGDKQETAVNIAYSCNLLSSDTQIMEESDLWRLLNNAVESRRNVKDKKNGTDVLVNGTPLHRMALVLTGDFLSSLTEACSEQDPEMSFWKKLVSFLRMKKKTLQSVNLMGRSLVEIACQCQSVICCRVTPKQKASIVNLVKTNTKVTTLGIGDGGNDVNMLKTAHVGVGIIGKEGLQAVLASDFAVAQFSFLQRLLFVHGRWSYLRFSKFLCYYNYKTFASLINNIWFAFFNGFTALLTYDSWFLMFNAILFTLYPSLCMGILDKDMDSKTSLQHPELYIITQKDVFLSRRIFLYVLYGAYTSLVMFFIPYAAFIDSAGPGGIFDYQVFTFTMSTICVLSVLAQAVIEISTWSVFAFLAIALSLTWYLLISFLTELPSAYFTNNVYFNYLDVMITSLSSGYIWLIFLLAVIVSIGPSHFIISWNRLTTPCLENSKRKNIKLHTDLQRKLSRRRSSYAFSHSEGYGNLLTRGTSLRKSKDQEAKTTK
ncbi:phospholipid-transporting ATPase IC-like [Rhinophrynus dorsalis]